MSKKIWLSRPAPTGTQEHHEWYGNGWNEAYPIGNGSLGAMVYGDPIHDTLQLNEETIWLGNGGRNRVNPKSKDNYLKVRQLLVEGKIKEAVKLEEETMFPHPDQERNYDTAENIWFDYAHGEYTDYKRTLDLETAVCCVEYTCGEDKFKREFFASAPDKVIAIHQYSENGAKTSCKIDFSQRSERTIGYELTAEGLLIHAKEGEDGCAYSIGVSCETVGGMSIFKEKSLEIFDADEFIMYITIRTDFHGDEPDDWCERVLSAAGELGFDEIKSRHIADYKSYFDRATLTLDGDDYSDIPTDERLKLIEQRPDNKLMELYFDFGRYLLISSSRPGTIPANLQGIWNKDRYPAWGSKYTININAEMNYWPAESTNLSDCHMPLIEHLKVMLPNGKKVARDMYGLNGFVAHHNTDIFGDCAPQDLCITATIWPMGAAWLCTHIWTHYEYTKDDKFLAEYLPIIKEACLFFTEYLFELDGKLLTGPSISPENTYIHQSGEWGQICVGPTMDSMLLIDLFTSCIKASRLLGEEDDLTHKLEEMLKKIPKPSIGKHGQIMEWYEDYDEVEPGHRHISHLYGLHPSNQITYEQTPELMDAARVTLDRRLSAGGGHTGWSRAWIINMWARLRDAQKSYENVKALLSRSTYPNFFDMHPPFQIDGNFGGTAGIAEMLLQSQSGVIVLLPALPDEWQSGEVKGLKAKGDITVDISWSEGRVTYSKLTANQGGAIKFAVPQGYGEEGIAEVSNSGVYSVIMENGEIRIEK